MSARILASPNKSLASVMSPQRLGPFARFARALKYVSAIAGEKEPGLMVSELSSTLEVGQARVLGVRAAKDQLSNILNDASEGQVTFVASGNGGTVAMIDVDLLADVFASLEAANSVTFGDVLRGAAGRKKLDWRDPTGHPPAYAPLPF